MKLDTRTVIKAWSSDPTNVREVVVELAQKHNELVEKYLALAEQHKSVIRKLQGWLNKTVPELNEMDGELQGLRWTTVNQEHEIALMDKRILRLAEEMESLDLKVMNLLADQESEMVLLRRRIVELETIEQMDGALLNDLSGQVLRLAQALSRLTSTSVSSGSKESESEEMR